MQRAGVVSAFALVSVLVGSSALAQEQQQQQQPLPQPQPLPQGQGQGQPQPEAQYEEQSVLQGVPGGLTAPQVGRRAAETSYQAKAAAEALRGAAARVDEAWSAFLPRLSTVASYTRLSPLTPPSLGSILLTTASCPPGQLCPVVPGTTPEFYSIFSFPVIVDNWLLQATLTVPISDYILRIDQNYTAATQARDAARFDLAAALTKSASDGEIAFYNYLGAQGALLVARLTLDDQKTHLTDTKNLAAAGNATRVDVLRGETAVSAAELAVVRTQNLVELTAKQLRVAMHVGDSYSLAAAEALDASTLPPVQGNLPTLISEAQSQRFEVRSIDANAAAAREQAKVARAGAYPALSAFGDATVANPNQRVFPLSQTWFPTWDLGVRLTWSPNDVPTSLAGAADAESRAASLDAQKQVIRDDIAVEVTQAYQAVQEADFSLQSTAKQLASAREAVRVARELYKAGRVNSTTLTDAETDLTRARLAVLNARLDARTSRVRLQHALGRDNRFIKLGP